MTANLSPAPKWTFLASDGTFLAGGKLSTFAAGTTTNKAAYKGPSGTTAHTNPIILDSVGRTEVWLDGSYKLKLTDADDSEQWTVDNVSSFDNLEHATTGRHKDPDASSYADFATAVSTIGATETTLVISDTQTVSADTTLPATLLLRVIGAGELSVDALKTLTINSPKHIDASPDLKIFAGTGTIAFTDKDGTVYPEWWGIDGTADEVQINAALDSLALTVELRGPTTYELVEHLEVESDKQRLVGVGWPTLRTAAATTNGVIVLVTNKADVEVTGLILDGNSLTLHGMSFRDDCPRPNIHHNQINDTPQYGIVFVDAAAGNAGGFDGAKILYNIITGIGDDGTHASTPFVSQAIEIFPKYGALTYSTNIEIAHNWIYDVKVGTITAGIKVQNYDSPWVHHNDVDLSSATANTAGITMPANSYPVAEFNTVKNANAGISVSGVQNTADGNQVIVHAKVVGNTIEGGTISGRAVFSAGGFGAKYLITGNYGNGLLSGGIDFDTHTSASDSGYGDIIASKNFLYGSAGSISFADTNSRGYNVLHITLNAIDQFISTAANNALVSENTSSGSRSFGIRVSGDDVKVLDNQILNFNTANSAAPIVRSGIYSDNNSRPQIRGNTIQNGATGNGKYGIELNTVVSPKMENNFIYTMDTAPTLFTAVTAIFGTLANSATPSIGGGESPFPWLTGGTSAITDFDDGWVGQVIEIHAEHATTITDGTNILLSGSVDFGMNASDTLTLRLKADNKWYETARSDNT